jgi:hypothetical protein
MSVRLSGDALCEVEERMNPTELIERLNARACIADLVHRYAKNVRRGETADCMHLFTADATFETRESVPGQSDSLHVRSTLKGREAILSYLNKDTVRGKVCPVISNLLIDVEEDRASSSCVMNAVVWATGQTLLGEYQDTYRREAQWRFVSRTYTIFRTGQP